MLTPLTVDVDAINDKVMSIWPGEERTYLSAHVPDDGDASVDLYPPEVLNTFSSGGLPPHSLSLKAGAPIILLRNMNAAKGRMNGTRLVVVRLTERIIQARILAGPFAGNDAIIPRIPMRPSDSNSVPAVFTRTQFPVRPAFALTIAFKSASSSRAPVTSVKFS